MENNNTIALEKDLLIRTLCLFIQEIGIGVFEKEIDENTFLPGLKIQNGSLFFDKAKLLYPGDMLHEAGHIAVTTKSERETLANNVILDKPEKNGDELAVILWTYAACIKMNLPPEIVFHKTGYKGDSEWLLENFKNETFIGLPLLKWMGMTTDEFPIMVKWLRD